MMQPLVFYNMERVLIVLFYPINVFDVFGLLSGEMVFLMDAFQDTPWKGHVSH